jgi:hypothetical protein
VGSWEVKRRREGRLKRPHRIVPSWRCCFDRYSSPSRIALYLASRSDIPSLHSLSALLLPLISVWTPVPVTIVVLTVVTVVVTVTLPSTVPLLLSSSVEVDSEVEDGVDITEVEDGVDITEVEDGEDIMEVEDGEEEVVTEEVVVECSFNMPLAYLIFHLNSEKSSTHHDAQMLAGAASIRAARLIAHSIHLNILIRRMIAL